MHEFIIASSYILNYTTRQHIFKIDMLYQTEEASVSSMVVNEIMFLQEFVKLVSEEKPSPNNINQRNSKMTGKM